MTRLELFHINGLEGSSLPSLLERASSLRSVVYGYSYRDNDPIHGPLLRNTNLISLKLHDVWLDEVPWRGLSTDLRALDVSCQNGQDSFQRYIFPVLAQNRTLQDLRWTGSQVEVLALLGLTQTNTSLKKLDLRAYGYAIHIPFVGSHVKAGRMLQEFHLEADMLGSDTCIGVFRALVGGDLPRLHTLQVESSHGIVTYPPEFLHALLRMCSESRTLRKLTLGGMKVDIRALLVTLARNPALLEVYLRLPVTERDILECLLPALTTNTTMYLIACISSGAIDEAAARDIQEKDYRVRCY